MVRRKVGTREQAIKSEDTGGAARKSESSIVVSIPGNAGGVKGRRFEEKGSVPNGTKLRILNI